MADLISILTNSAHSLMAQRATTQIAAHNLMNSATPGYSRQRGNLAAVTPAQLLPGAGYLGRGVEIQSVTQARDRFLESQIPTAIASRAESQTMYEALISVQAFDPSGDTGVSAAMAEFYASFRELAQNPGDLGLRRAAVSAAERLTRAFDRTAQTLDDARHGVDFHIRELTEEVSELTKKMADLNHQIYSASSTGHPPNDLFDERFRVRDRIAEITGAKAVTDGDGHISMYLPSGATLVSGPIASSALQTRADANNRGHLQVEMVNSDSSGPVRIPNSALGGELGGYLQARDDALAGAEQGLDQLAFEFAEMVNAVHRGGYAMNGDTGRDLFTHGGSVEGAARTLALNTDIVADPNLLQAAGDPAALSGDPDNLLSILATEKEHLSSGATAAGTLADVASDFARYTRRAESAYKMDLSIENNFIARREAVSGVSIDEEMVELTKAQHAYNATLKVIQSADEMLQGLMRI